MYQFQEQIQFNSIATIRFRLCASTEVRIQESGDGGIDIFVLRASVDGIEWSCRNELNRRIQLGRRIEMDRRRCQHRYKYFHISVYNIYVYIFRLRNRFNSM